MPPKPPESLAKLWRPGGSSLLTRTKERSLPATFRSGHEGQVLFDGYLMGTAFGRTTPDQEMTQPLEVVRVSQQSDVPILFDGSLTQENVNRIKFYSRKPRPLAAEVNSMKESQGQLAKSLDR